MDAVVVEAQSFPELPSPAKLMLTSEPQTEVASRAALDYARGEVVVGVPADSVATFDVKVSACASKVSDLL